MAYLRRYTDVLAGQVAAQLSKQSFGRNLLFEVSVQPVQNEVGIFLMFSVILSMPNPLLGRPPLLAMVQGAGTAPDSDGVRVMVAQGIEALDKEQAKALAQSNGAAQN